MTSTCNAIAYLARLGDATITSTVIPRATCSVGLPRKRATGRVCLAATLPVGGARCCSRSCTRDPHPNEDQSPELAEDICRRATSVSLSTLQSPRAKRRQTRSHRLGQTAAEGRPDQAPTLLLQGLRFDLHRSAGPHPQRAPLPALHDSHRARHVPRSRRHRVRGPPATRPFLSSPPRPRRSPGMVHAPRLARETSSARPRRRCASSTLAGAKRQRAFAAMARPGDPRCP